MTTRRAVIASVVVVFVAMAGGTVLIFATGMDQERARQLGRGLAMLIGICLALPWLLWAQRRRNAQAAPPSKRADATRRRGAAPPPKRPPKTPGAREG